MNALPEPGFSFVDALFQLIQFVGWFLSIGAGWLSISVSCGGFTGSPTVHAGFSLPITVMVGLGLLPRSVCTLLVMSIVGIHGVIRRGPSGTPRAELATS